MELHTGFGIVAALSTWWIHTFLGGRRILEPLQNAEMPRFAKATMSVCWHATTHCLSLVVISLVGASFWGSEGVRQGLLTLVIAFCLPAAGIFLVISKKTYGRWLTMPQSFLLGHIALWSSLALFRPVWLAAGTCLSILLGVLLLLLAALHFLWARGSSWPSRSQEELVQLVVGQPKGHPFPGAKMTLAVAYGLAGFGVFMFLPVWTNVPGVYYRVFVLGLAVLFALRGFGGYFEPYLRPWTVDLPYGYWNRVLYSPICLAMGGMAFAIAYFGA